MKRNTIIKQKTAGYLTIAYMAIVGCMMPAESYSQYRGQRIKNQIRVKSNDIKPENDSVTVDFDIILRNYSVTADRQLILTPVIADANGNERIMPDIIVNGKRRANIYQRMQRLDRMPDSLIYHVTNTPKEIVNETFHYRFRVPYEGWMKEAGVFLYADLCGCAGEKQELSEWQVAERIKIPEKPVFSFTYTPKVAFIQPPKEEIKKREEAGSAYVVFRSGQAVIQPALFDNRAELEKIESSLNYVKSEPTAQITAITIQAYASPEGTYQGNLNLSQKRAGALKSYVGRNYGIATHLIRAEGMGENWTGLEKLVQEDISIENKTEVLDIIRSVDVFDGREKKLMRLSGGKVYKYMLTSLFPRLRRSDYRIEYTVPSFTIDKGKELLDTRPGMLSLEEMYLIANTYKQGSPEFNKVFDIAIRLYPEDKTANLNAAAAYLLEGKQEDAQKILEKYKDEPEAWNNLGVLMIEQQKAEEAEKYLIRAKNAEVAEAGQNLTNLELLKQAQEDYDNALKEYERYAGKN